MINATSKSLILGSGKTWRMDWWIIMSGTRLQTRLDH